MTLVNQLINLVWTILAFLVFVLYWYANPNLIWLIAFLLISTAGSMIPLRWYQLSTVSKFYERLGVRLVRKFVQDGDFINTAIRKKSNTHRVIKDRRNYGSFLQTVNMYERYHIHCLIFFLLSTAHAAYHQHYPTAFLMLVSNVIYNLCPILLQQYNRLRIAKIAGRPYVP
ncbi:glycosyl-4,4'-diaponeurosporenoate acyltransferase CrtO family protein [Dyadobacter arcticus]|uniref:Glycosyl-4,4'-diaponeurosporenoate acyltransferase n=1 Tax=Dyadobacter arcticus TaxID=1078754 RepID=A0ABX0UNF0_9BACT|nr:hypothetical protein [Dyadobacter arcticus]NIJ54402.1 hypothetical protein [Dyadobacter arcticus]